MKAAITILDLGYDYAREIAELRKLNVEADFIPLEGTNDTDEIGKALSGYDFVLAGPELWSEETFAVVGKSLKLIARLGVGVDKIDLAAATRHGVAVCNAPGGNAPSVAQHALALMLDLARDVTSFDRMVRENRPYRRVLTHDLIGKVVGLVGFGRISAQLAKLLQGFNCIVLAYDIYQNQALADSLGVHFVTLDDLLSRSDFVSLHMPLTEQTRGMVDRKFFQKMKKDAYFINTARGAIVNEADLTEALKAGEIAGAGLDVFVRPLEGNELLSLDNVIVTPYIAFSSELGNRLTLDMAIACVGDYLSKRPLKNLPNPEYTNYL